MTIARITADGVSAGVGAARVQIPAWGRWWADVDALTPIDLAAGAPVALEIADVVLRGTVVSGGTHAGRAAYRIVAGAGAWSRTVPARAYRDGSGVQRSTVIADVAAAVGEPIDGAPAGRVGEHYARAEGPASRVLHELAPRAWYVDRDGVTRFGVRPAVVYTGAAPRVDVRPAAGCVELAVAELGPFVPGVVVDGRAPAVDVEYLLTSSRLSVRVFAGATMSRDLESFARLLDALDPRRAYRGAFDFRVVTQDGHTLNLQPVRASAGLPDLERVPVRLAPGVRAKHFLGSLVTVVFLDADPSRPCVITGDDAGAPGWMPLELELGDGVTLGVARLGDTVLAGPWAGVITNASVRVKAGL